MGSVVILFSTEEMKVNTVKDTISSNKIHKKIRSLLSARRLQETRNLIQLVGYLSVAITSNQIRSIYI